MKHLPPPSRARALTFGLCAAVLLVPSLDAQRRDDRRYGVAVVREDGAIIPFAEYDDGRWREMWSATERGGFAFPMSLDGVDEDWWRDVEPSSVWQLWKRPGVSDVLTVDGVRSVSTPCSADVALTTNFTPAGSLPPANVAPYPKAGLATTAGIAYEPVVALDSASAAYARVRDALDRSFDRLEVNRLYEMRWGHPVPQDDRRQSPIELKTALHVPGSRFYYFEAMRRYADPDPPREAPPCGLVTFISGFFWQSGRGGLVPVSTGTLVSYCHLEDASYLWPLGVIREGSRAYWVVQAAGWTSEAYGIIEPDEEDGEVREHVWHAAGRCGHR